MSESELLESAGDAIDGAAGILLFRYHSKLPLSHEDAVKLLQYSRKLDCAATALECDARGIPQPKVG